MKIYNFLGNLGTLILLILNIKALFGKSIASGIGPNAEYNYFMFFIIYGILSFILIIAYLCKKREDSQQSLLLFSNIYSSIVIKINLWKHSNFAKSDFSRRKKLRVQAISRLLKTKKL